MSMPIRSPDTATLPRPPDAYQTGERFPPPLSPFFASFAVALIRLQPQAALSDLRAG